MRLALLAGLAALACSKADPAKPLERVQVTSTSLAQSFRSDEVAATHWAKGKLIEVSGRLIGKRVSGEFAELGLSDEAPGANYVTLRRVSMETAAPLNVPTGVRAECKFDFMSEGRVYLTDCTLL
jgi:hypothetical protein